MPNLLSRIETTALMPYNQGRRGSRFSIPLLSRLHWRAESVQISLDSWNSYFKDYGKSEYRWNAIGSVSRETSAWTRGDHCIVQSFHKMCGDHDKHRSDLWSAYATTKEKVASPGLCAHIVSRNRDASDLRQRLGKIPEGRMPLPLRLTLLTVGLDLTTLSDSLFNLTYDF